MTTKFIFTELVDGAEVITARLGAGTGSGNWVTDAEVGKFAKLAADSRYDLCAAGDNIEGRISSVDAATQDNYSIGGVMTDGRFACTFDGLQATPGTGVLAVGDYVCAGTAVAKGTALTAPARVCKATTQATVSNSPFAWRVISLGAAASGAVGTTGVMELAC